MTMGATSASTTRIGETLSLQNGIAIGPFIDYDYTDRKTCPKVQIRFLIKSALLNKPMKKSSKLLVGGTFLIASLAFAGSLFAALGMDFGMAQILGSTLAGAAGAARLVA